MMMIGLENTAQILHFLIIIGALVIVTMYSPKILVHDNIKQPIRQQVLNHHPIHPRIINQQYKGPYLLLHIGNFSVPHNQSNKIHFNNTFQ